MKKIILFLLILIPVITVAQLDTFNQIDGQGRKQGYWKKYEKEKLIYEGRFVNDVPTGTFTYYYANGKIKSTSNFLNGVHKVESTLYDEQEKKMAEGLFIDQEKHGQWNYFNNKGSLIKIESYKNGKKEGVWKTFSNQTGIILKEEHYKNNTLDGPRITYFANGDTNTVSNYIDGRMNGKYISFYPDKKLSYQGTYYQNKRIGAWDYYDFEEKLRKTVEYKDDIRDKIYLYFYNGTVAQKLDQSTIAYIRKIDERKTEVTSHSNKKIVFNDSYESIFNWLDFIDFCHISPSLTASYDALKGYTKRDKESITVKLLPKPNFDPIAKGDYAKMIIGLFDTTKIEN